MVGKFLVGEEQIILVLNWTKVEARFTKPIKYWVPSIAVSAMTIYKGKEFKEWNGDALISSLKDQSLRKIKFKENKFIIEEIIFKGNIGRIRDLKIHPSTGEIFLLSDNGVFGKCIDD